jgi:hypothetical protein
LTSIGTIETDPFAERITLSDSATATFTGVASFITFSVDSNLILVDGQTYTYGDENADDYQRSKNFHYAKVYVGATFVNGEADYESGGSSQAVSGGSFTVKKSGTGFGLEYSFTFTGGGTAKGKFVGPLTDKREK